MSVPPLNEAQLQVQRLEAELAAGQAGMKSFTNDGTSVAFDRKQVYRELRYWRAQAARLAGGGGLAARFVGVDLSRGPA